MKKVVIFGAAGHTGKYITRKMKQQKDVELTVFVRNPAKFGDMDLENVKVTQGDVLSMARNIVNALPETTVKRIIWITGMGIHHEITGLRGMMLNMLAKQRPEYIEAADLIAGSSAVTTLLRCPGIKDGDNEQYYLTKEGVQPAKRDIDHAGIAKCMAE